MPTLKAVITLELDGQPILNSPIERRIEVDEQQQFHYQRTTGGGFLAPTTLGEIQFLLVQSDKAVTLRLDGQSDAGIVLNAGGLVLLVDVDIDAGASTNATVDNSAGSTARLKGLAGGT